jgi:uncharacterized protein (TIGR02646 family)
MHKLERGIAPAGLHYQPNHHKWGEGVPTPDEYSSIWDALSAMQEGRCAYCEAILKDDAKHIEHFGARNPNYYPQGEFEWANLFGSCNCRDSCGKHKDGKGRPHSWRELIKPDVDDPADFFIFESDGDISPRDNLSPGNLKRAEETLRVFNLKNNFDLRNARMTTLRRFKQQAADHAACWEEMPEEVIAEIDRLLDEANSLPYISWIRHTLKAVLTQTG